jgi:hypothetical protein
MNAGAAPGANFFDDSSGDDNSEWEDDNGTRNFSEVEGLGIRNSLLRNSMLMDDESEEETRGRKRTSDVFKPIPTHSSRTAVGHDDSLSGFELKDTKKAREISLRRFGSVRIVHNRGSGCTGRNTARESIVSNDSGRASAIDAPSRLSVELRGGHGDARSSSVGFEGRHRRNTSESLRADSILNAHARTMQALEALSPSGSFSRATDHFAAQSRHSPGHGKPRATSLSDYRHIHLPPLQPGKLDPNRPAHLQAHFVKTPYPFMARKEFPKPKSRPRQIGLARAESSGEYEYDDKKGRHVLGVASEGEYDLGSRLERNADSQDLIRMGRKSGDGARQETVIWLSLQRRSRGEMRDGFEHIIIPSSLTTTSQDRSGGKKFKMRSGSAGGQTVDFDDMFFAHQLRDAYKKLAGSLPLRLLSARKLRYIQLGRVSVWSGFTSSSRSYGRPSKRDVEHGHLLATKDGFDTTPDAQTPFTEHNLMHLFRHPAVGKARYTWVHWAQRVSAVNTPIPSSSLPPTSPSSKPRRAQSLGASSLHLTQSNSMPSFLHAHSLSTANPPLSSHLTTIQFVHSFSPFRILGVLGIMIALSVLAALLWIFLGVSAWTNMSEVRGRADRVGSGMAVGGLVLAVEGVIFGAWVVGSWLWA